MHDAFAALVAGEIQIEMLAHEPIRHTGKSIKRVLDSVTKQLAAQAIVIERHAQRKFHIRGASAVPEVQVVFPTRIEKFPLQIGHLDQLGAVLLLHARVLERHEESGNERPLGVAQIVKQVERFFRVCVSLARQSDDESAERKPVMLV